MHKHRYNFLILDFKIQSTGTFTFKRLGNFFFFKEDWMYFKIKFCMIFHIFAGPITLIVVF